MLTPTRIYVKSLLPAIRTGCIKGLSHITGGGFIDNVPRVLPPALGCYIDVSGWRLPPEFKFLMDVANISPHEMCRTFNNGVGMVLIVARQDVAGVKAKLLESGEQDVYEMGEVTAGKGVVLKGLETWAA